MFPMFPKFSSSLKIAVVLGLLIFVSTSPVYANVGRLGIVPEGFCTQDHNDWNHPSRCTCTHGATYSPKAGLCLVGYPYQVALRGTLGFGHAPDASVTFDTYQGPYHLILRNELKKELGEAHTSCVELDGELIVEAGEEIPMRRSIIVENLRLREPHDCGIP